jgi:hypothetical protein
MMPSPPRPPRTELRRASPPGGKAPTSTPEQQAALLGLNQRIIDQELRIKRLKFYRRLGIVWLVFGPVVIVTTVIVSHILLDYTDHADLKPEFNGWGASLTVASLVVSALITENRHQYLQAALAELSKLQEERKLLLSMGAIGTVATQRRYKEEVLGFIEEYRRELQRNRRIHNFLQSTIIVGSIVTTSVTSAIGQQPWFKWIAVGLSLTVGISAGFTGYFKFRERAMNLRQTADAIEHEYNAAELGIRAYKHLSPEEALAALAEQIEWLREEQRKREQQLEQPPEARTTQAQ